MVALTGDGAKLRTLNFPADIRTCDSLAVSPDGTWAGAGLRDGRVCVIDIRQGQIIAQGSGQGSRPMVAWATRDNSPSPLLLVATGRELNAFRVKPMVGSGDTAAHN